MKCKNCEHEVMKIYSKWCHVIANAPCSAKIECYGEFDEELCVEYECNCKNPAPVECEQKK